MEDHSSGKTYEENAHVQLPPICSAVGVALTCMPVFPNGRVIQFKS